MPPASRRTSFLICCLIATASFVALAPVLRNQFINWDDRDQIIVNPDFNPVRFGRMIEYWRGPYVGSLYPISYNLFGVLTVLGRVDPAPGEVADTISPVPFHAASLLIHIASAWLVFAILRI